MRKAKTTAVLGRFGAAPHGILARRWALFALVTLALALGCGDDDPFGNSSGVYLVRVLNSMPEPISVVIGPADYGSILSNDTTDYRRVNEGDNEILLNGEVFQGSPVEFAVGLPGTHHWAYEFGENSWGFFADDLF